MPKRFETKIVKARFAARGYTAEEMNTIASRLLDEGIRPRIRRGEDVNDAPAPPLSENYRKRKLRNNKKPIRDWDKTGRTLGSMKVLSAAPNHAVIGFTNPPPPRIPNKRSPEAPGLIAAILNRRSLQFGVSRREMAFAKQLFEGTASPVEVKKTA